MFTVYLQFICNHLIVELGCGFSMSKSVQSFVLFTNIVFYILQEIDAALMSVISFPAFAVDDGEIIENTRKIIQEKLEVIIYTIMLQFIVTICYVKFWCYKGV